MALVVADRVKETTTTSGTGTYDLGGVVTGFQSFATAVGNTNTTYYACTDGNGYEIGIGTYASTGNTLARTTILKSTNSNAAVNWGTSTKEIFVTYPAEKSVFKDASGDLTGVTVDNSYWSGADLAVENGGTGASTLTDGGVLLGSGTGAITAMAVLGDGEMIVGDGTTDPVAESGATLRTSIGVAIGSDVQAYDADLTALGGLAKTDSNFIVGNGSTWVAENGATARTSLGLGTAAVLDTGISDTNIAKFTSGVADNDFLRVDGTAIEGLNASEVLSEIGGQASLTFGISNTNAVKIDSASVADDEYARFTANGLESRSTSEVLSDIGGQASLTFGKSDTNALKLEEAVAEHDILLAGSSNVKGRTYAELKSDLSLNNVENTALSTGTALNATNATHVSVADNESTDENNLITFIENASATGNVGLESDGDFHYNPSTGKLTATQLAGTLQTAAQANITSVGTLTGLTISGDVTFTGDNYNVLWDKDEDALEFADNAKAVFGTDDDFKMYHATHMIMVNETGDILIQNSANDKDIVLLSDNGSGGHADYLVADGSTGEVKLHHYGSIKLATKSTGVDVTGDLTLTSTDTGSGALPLLKLYRNSASPADWDYSGATVFQGENSAGETIDYASLIGRIEDVTDGTEDGRIEVYQMQNGSSVQSYALAPNKFQFINEQNLEWYQHGGTSYDVTLAAGTPTADRTITLPDATGTVSLLTATETLTNKTLTTPVINGFSGTGDGAITGNLALTSTDAGATAAPIIELYRHSASPAADDVLGSIDFYGEDANDDKVKYASVEGGIFHPTEGNERGFLYLKVMQNGSMQDFMRFGSGGIYIYKAPTIATGFHLQNADTTFNRVSAGVASIEGNTIITTANADAGATTTSSSDADHVLIDDGGVLKKITPANLGIGGGGGSGITTGKAIAMAMVFG